VRRDETLHAVFAFYYEAFPEDICMRGGDLGTREALEDSRGVTRNVTRFGKHNYLREVATLTRRHIHTHDTRYERKGERVNVGVRDERENIESHRRNIARCVMHERASDSRCVNSQWIDAMKQKKHAKKVRCSEM